ncbi:trihelix transcription factor GTL2 [Ziziphus jujuba]|uniref:Trihelix transcription factor GTL2 n=2 Tax=Ziziphus jujuba TaxID=326968 RepID=A0A6P3ZWI2_ZIZJJ|nr:trihelix transcription factor GTL2 [Ziziphus jujuba]XP_024930915.2 trihelix transcription factor GTL2 [Ziziphus jujuba]KAH7523875.1 hypothetical protein FEM48_Zijuj06G0058400 [Ziziphus jujuba var. spinosa]
MQSDYEIAGIVPHQQFMDTDCCSSVFPLLTPPIPNHHDPLHHHQHHPQLHHHSQQQQKQQQHYHMNHNHPVHPVPPITHQFFQQQRLPFQALQHQQQQEEQQQGGRLHHHHQQQQLRLEQEPGQSPNNFFPVNFKLGLNENSRRQECALNGELFHGNELHASESTRPYSSGFLPKCWQTQEYSATREPFWNPLGTDISNTNKKHSQVDVRERCKELESKYRLYGELEAIYSLAKIGETNQTGSGSALTGENSPATVDLAVPLGDPHGHNDGATVAVGVDNGSEASIGEETTTVRKVHKTRKTKRKLKEQLNSMTEFLESLVKQVMSHQESLHKRFLEVLEKIDKERREREEAWRREEAEKHNREVIARVREQALASRREAVIVSYMEKITGQRINLPSRRTTPLLFQQPEISTEEPAREVAQPNIKIDTNSRWPKSEVEALIRVRSGVEVKFQEPGPKGPLWEAVSALMASMGYQRSAKRCKEKWENINKYFRKSKDSGKKRSQQSKTCSYFDQLDQLYTRTPNNDPSSSSVSSGFEVQRQSYTELLEAFTAGGDDGIAQTLSGGNFDVSEMGSSKFRFNGIVDDKLGFEGEEHGTTENENHDDDDNEDVEGVEEKEDGVDEGD